MTRLCVRCDIIRFPRSLQGTNPYSHFSGETFFRETSSETSSNLPQIPLWRSSRVTGQSRTVWFQSLVPLSLFLLFSCEDWRGPRRAGRPSDTSICGLSPNAYVCMLLSLIFAWNLRGYFEIRCSACLFSHFFSIQSSPSRLAPSEVRKLKKQQQQQTQNPFFM